ncbi:MAG: hypothetical protein M3Q60_16775, partial [Actinomycetota bacterium]|nr:hypothetical protein [Actinomycetota bacterium]
KENHVAYRKTYNGAPPRPSRTITGTTLLAAGVELAIRPGREEFRAQTSALRERLNDGMQCQLETELCMAVKNMRDSIAHYDKKSWPASSAEGVLNEETRHP